MLVELVKSAWLRSVTEAELARRSGQISDERQPGDYQPFYDLLADDVVWRIACPEDTPYYGAEVHGKQALIELFKSEPERIVDVDWELPPEFLGRGDRVVMLGQERWTIRKNGVTKRNSWVAMVMDFRDGLIARILLITDMSEWNEAYRSPGWSSAT